MKPLTGIRLLVLRCLVPASFACPLIISIPGEKYRAVEFHENSKLVKRLAISNE